MPSPDQLWHIAFGVAYRILGVPWQAEDAAQSTMERWLGVSHDAVKSPSSFIARMAANQALNMIRSDTRLREKHRDFGLPMPVPEMSHDAIDARIDLSFALTATLMKLPAMMRAVFILRTAFDMPFAEIGEGLDRSTVACRQAFSRANRILTSHETADKPAAANLGQLQTLIGLIQAGDPKALARHMARDIAFESDGGETGPAFGQTIVGANRIAQFLSVSSVLLGQKLDVGFHHSPSGYFFSLSEADKLKLVGLAEFGAAGCTRIFAISDTDKLARFHTFLERSLSG